jgi:hypothetical protein
MGNQGVALLRPDSIANLLLALIQGWLPPRLTYGTHEHWRRPLLFLEVPVILVEVA